MLKKRTSRKIITLIMAFVLVVISAIPAGAFAETSSDDGYIYKYIGTDSSNKGGSISYYDTDTNRRSGSSAIMFKLRNDNDGNVDLAYCCDLDTYTVDNTYYKRTNLENAGYFEADVARSIRNVVVNGYDPANSSSIKDLEAAVNNWAKKNNKEEQVSGLAKSDAITATQLAIWSLANPEMNPASESKTVNLVKDYLVSLPEYEAAPDEMVAESLGVTANMEKEPETDKVTLSGTFSFYSNAAAEEPIKTRVTPEGDEITFGIKVGAETLFSDSLSNMMAAGTVVLDDETLEYTYEIKGIEYETELSEVVVDIAVSGVQELPRGAYFYKTPKRGDSQNFVGIADWNNTLDLYAAATAKVIDLPEKADPPQSPDQPQESDPPLLAAPPQSPDIEQPAEQPEIPDVEQDVEQPEIPDAEQDVEQPQIPDVEYETELSQSPDTGDDSGMVLWAMIAITSLAAAVMMALKKRGGSI